MTTLGSVVVPFGLGTAQNNVPPKLIAAYLLNFIKYTRWPDSQSKPATVCTLQAPALSEFLAGLGKRTVNGKDVDFKAIGESNVQECALVFFETSSHLKTFESRLPTAPILTVGPEGIGAVIELEFDGEYLKFSVDLGKAKTKALEFDAQMLRLSSNVKPS
jgi:YfiR/HmsC-like